MRFFILCFLVSVLAGIPASSASGRRGYTDENAVRAIIGEAAGEGEQGMQAVAEVIRRRGSLKGFYGLNAPHVDKQPAWVWKRARKAWEASETSNITAGADHFENVKAFGVPKWARGHKPVAVIGSHTFWRLRK